MSRRRYIGGTYGLLPTDINDLRTWKVYGSVLLDIAYKDNKSDMVFKNTIGSRDILYRKIRVKPNKLYKLVFSYEVKNNYELTNKESGWLGLGVNRDLQGAIIEKVGRKDEAETYYPFSSSPKRETVKFFFIPNTEVVILYLSLFQVKDNGAQFVIGDITMSEEELPTITEDDAHRNVRILTSGKGGVLEVTHTDNRIENISLPAGRNTISLPAEVQKISFAGENRSDEKNAILWADLGNVKIRDFEHLFEFCKNLKACYGVNLTAGNDFGYTFAFCERLVYIDKLDFININYVTWLSLKAPVLKSMRIQNLGAKLKYLDLRLTPLLSIESVEYMVDNSAVPIDATCKVFLTEKLINSLSVELINKAKEKRLILSKN